LFPPVWAETMIFLIYYNEVLLGNGSFILMEIHLLNIHESD